MVHIDAAFNLFSIRTYASFFFCFIWCNHCKYISTIKIRVSISKNQKLATTRNFSSYLWLACSQLWLRLSMVSHVSLPLFLFPSMPLSTCHFPTYYFLHLSHLKLTKVWIEESVQPAKCGIWTWKRMHRDTMLNVGDTMLQLLEIADLDAAIWFHIAALPRSVFSKRVSRHRWLSGPAWTAVFLSSETKRCAPQW